MHKPFNQANQSNHRPSNGTPKPSAYWGLSSHEFYRGLANKPVKITALDGKLYGGTLVGVDQYDLFLRQANGLTLLFPKHAIKYLHADSANSSESGA